MGERRLLAAVTADCYWYSVRRLKSLFSDKARDGEGGATMRCLECGSEQAGDAGECARCGAPAGARPTRPAVVMTGRGRAELRIDEHGVRVRNPWWDDGVTRAIGWDEVGWFSFRVSRRGGWALAIVLKDGSIVIPHATRKPRQASQKAIMAVRQAARQYAIPEVLTGQPAGAPVSGDDGQPDLAATVRCLECGADPAETMLACVRCGAPAGLQQPVAGSAAAGPAPVRCLECAAEPAEIAQVCVRCAAPVGSQQPVAAAPPAGGPGKDAAWAGSLVAEVLVIVAVLTTLVITVAALTQPAPNQLTWDQLRPGDCLAGSNMALGTDATWPWDVTQAACDKPHEAEVFFAGNIWPQSMAYPGADVIDSQAQARCDAAFAAYDGLDVSQSAFQYDAIFGDDSSEWASGERSLQCVAYKQQASGPSGAAPVDYSIKGSND